MNQQIPEEKILDLMRRENGLQNGRVLGARLQLFLTPPRLLRISRVMLGVATIMFIAVWFVRPDALLDKKALPVNEEWGLPETGAGPLEDYLDDIAKRDIIRHHLTTSRAAAGNLPYVDSIQHITLAGIVFEDPPQAVLKDTRTGDVFYVKTGASLGEFKIVSIEEGKVTLEYQDERIDLRM